MHGGDRVHPVPSILQYDPITELSWTCVTHTSNLARFCPWLQPETCRPPLLSLEPVTDLCPFPRPPALQKRYAAGIKEMLDEWLKCQPFKEENYIVKDGKIAGAAYA